jgi:serine/threonine-protein kinase
VHAVAPENLASMPGAGDHIGERYTVERLLGQGAAGVVYAAVHDYTGRPVAIKWIHPHVARDVTNAHRFLREARAAASVQHPNVVEILDAGRDRETYYLVMERLEGNLLSETLKRGGLSVPAIARIFLTLMRGVAAAHSYGIVHRDLKPENVFLCPPERGRPGGAKVLDFGISKLRQGDKNAELTEAGVFVGSPYYMAPEQIADSRSVDARADVYSIGVMLFEALTGRVPFDAESLSALFAKVVTEKAPAIEDLRPDLPAALCDVVMRAMNADPKARYPTMREMAEALEPFAQGLRFDPGGDAFDVAWRERGSMIDVNMRMSDPPSAPDSTRDSDPAASAVARAKARAGNDAIPEQPTVIRARTERENEHAPPPSTSPISATPTVMADIGALPTRLAEPTESFARPPPVAPAPSMARALAPWIALAVVIAILMVALGIALVRLL